MGYRAAGHPKAGSGPGLRPRVAAFLRIFPYFTAGGETGSGLLGPHQREKAMDRPTGPGDGPGIRVGCGGGRTDGGFQAAGFFQLAGSGISQDAVPAGSIFGFGSMRRTLQRRGMFCLLYNAMDFCIATDKILHVKLKNLLFLKDKKFFSAKTVLSRGNLNGIRRI